MKRSIPSFLAGLFCGVLLLSGGVAVAAGLTANPSRQTIYVDSKKASLTKEVWLAYPKCVLLVHQPQQEKQEHTEKHPNNHSHGEHTHHKSKYQPHKQAPPFVGALW